MIVEKSFVDRDGNSFCSTDETDSSMEKSRQSARECRARKKLRYQYLDELVQDREEAVGKLLEELRMLELWSRQLDYGTIPPDVLAWIQRENALSAVPNPCAIQTNRPDQSQPSFEMPLPDMFDPSAATEYQYFDDACSVDFPQRPPYRTQNASSNYPWFSQ